MEFKPKLMVFDLDGTLAQSKQRVTADMGNLLAELTKHMPVAVMSGASFKQFENQFLPAIPADAKLANLYLFPDNAAQCYRYENGAWTSVYDESFTLMEREKIMRAFSEAFEETGMTKPPAQTWGERLEDRGAEIAFSALGQEAPLQAKEEWHKNHESERDALRVALAKRLPEFSVSEGGFTTVQITRRGVTKAYGIGKLAGLTGITVSEMLYVGDALQEGGNDAVVIPTGVRTQEVFGPEETAKIIEATLK